MVWGIYSGLAVSGASEAIMEIPEEVKKRTEQLLIRIGNICLDIWHYLGKGDEREYTGLLSMIPWRNIVIVFGFGGLWSYSFAAFFYHLFRFSAFSFVWLIIFGVQSVIIWAMGLADAERKRHRRSY